MDIEILDLCKENIQPLRKGRKASQLGLALQAEVNTELQEKLAKERGEFELAIITYDGPDLLQPRIDYVAWMEQTHIKHGKDCNLIPLLEDTITLLKDNDKYKQDPRFIELIVKYIEAQENAVELFQMVYSQGLGTMCAVLYKAWAEVLDQAQDYKRADQVYQLGIANHAQPLDMLKEAQEQFQLSVGRKMMLSGGDLNPPPPEEAPRQVLGKLKKDVGSVRRAHGAAGVLTIRQNKPATKQPLVFQDTENNYEHLISSAIQKNKLASIATSEKNNEENTMKPSTWSKGYNRREVSRIPSVPSTPSFMVHVDPDAETEAPKLPPKTPSNVLKTRKAELASSNAMEVFSSAHSARKALQSNLELYSGGREFSFEELRVAYYQRKSQKCEALKTPMKTPNQKSSPTFEDFQTPISAFKNLSLDSTNLLKTDEKSINPSSENSIIKEEVNERSDDNEVLFTPLKRVGFMPLTPSNNGINLVEFEETPSHTSQTKKTPLGFSILCDATPGSSEKSNIYPVKNDVLPTIDENQEIEDANLIKKVPNFGIKKKQLFSGSANPAEKRQTQFSIFTDDD